MNIEISKGIDNEIYEADKADVNDEINLEEIDQFLSSLETHTPENVDLTDDIVQEELEQNPLRFLR